MTNTRKRNDGHSTEFGLWLREQSELDSKVQGYVASNLDFIWSNYKTGEWMLIEEKRYNSKLNFAQKKLYELLHKTIQCSKFRGVHLVQFEKTNPDDGYVTVNGKTFIKSDSFMRFLKFDREVLEYVGTMFSDNNK